MEGEVTVFICYCLSMLNYKPIYKNLTFALNILFCIALKLPIPSDFVGTSIDKHSNKCLGRVPLVSQNMREMQLQPLLPTQGGTFPRSDAATHEIEERRPMHRALARLTIGLSLISATAAVAFTLSKSSTPVPVDSKVKTT